MNKPTLAMLLLSTVLIIMALPGQAADCDDADKLYELAKKEGAGNNYEAASKWLNKSVAACATYKNTYLLGRSEQKLGRKEQAMTAYFNAETLAQNPDQRAYAYARFGEVLQMSGKREKALEYLKAGLGLHSKPAPEWMTLATLELDKSLAAKPMTQGQIKRGLATLDSDIYMPLPEARKVSLDIRINFVFNSPDVDQGSWENIDNLAAALGDTDFSGKRFMLVGHSDVRGDKIYNRGLSLQRANTVKALLIERNADLTAIIDTAGAGEDDPLYWGDTEEEHLLNRRLQVIVE